MIVSFNPSTLAVKPGIRVGMGATDFAGASNGSAYVSEFGQGGAVGRIQVVNTSTDALTKTITLKQGVVGLTTAPRATRPSGPAASSRARSGCSTPARTQSCGA